MLNKYKAFVFFFVATLTFSVKDVGAQKITNPVLIGYVRAINGIAKDLPIEKVYLQLDKSNYILGDTLHFKAYVFNADYLTPTNQSGLLYVELDNINNKSVKRIVTPIRIGISNNDIALSEKDITEGNYTLRAYTNWMQNFGENYIFKKNISISKANYDATTLVSTAFKLDTAKGKATIFAKLKFSNYDAPVAIKDMRLEVLDGTHTLKRERVTTGIDGSANIDIALKERTPPYNLKIVARYLGKGVDTTELSIPVNLNRPEKTDIQFFPEGGKLVAGLSTKIGIKAVSEDGNGANVSGEIIDTNGLLVGSFKTTFVGMGVFNLIPEAGKRYLAKVKLPEGKAITYPLPISDTLGTALSLETKGDDSLVITVKASQNVPDKRFYLIGQSRGVTCYVAVADVTNGQFSQTVAKSNFPTGIAHFTLLNAQNQPLNERLVFVSHNDNLNIHIETDQTAYGIRDSVSLTVRVTDKNNKPVFGNFSLSITDDDQVKISSTDNNLLNTILFTSDLKGNIENPGYYFIDKSPERTAALDNLMLTQGWVGYSWKDVFNPLKQTPKYKAEREFEVKGRVTNVFNKPVKRTEVILVRKPVMVIDTLTDENGEFNFHGRGLLSQDTAIFLVEAKNKNGRNFNVGVEVEEFRPPDFSMLKNRYVRWYVNSDSTLMSSNKTKQAQNKAEGLFTGEGKQLKEVQINQAKLIPGSKNPNPEMNTLVWDQKDMDNANNATLGEMLVNKYNMFKHIRMAPNGEDYSYYTVKGKHFVKLCIDGWWVAPPQQYLDYLTAKDIKGVEIQIVFAPDPEHPMNLPADYAFIHVTTYSGNGQFTKHTPGLYTFKPIPYSTPKEFYRPRYNAANKTTSVGTDLRSTIHWVPNIFTNENGIAKVSFFTADKPATYTAIIEGTDINGSLGSQRLVINVKPKENAKSNQKSAAQ